MRELKQLEIDQEKERVRKLREEERLAKEAVLKQEKIAKEQEKLKLLKEKEIQK
jgi:hypothetical protein